MSHNSVPDMLPKSVNHLTASQQTDPVVVELIDAIREKFSDDIETRIHGISTYEYLKPRVTSAQITQAWEQWAVAS